MDVTRGARMFIVSALCVMVGCSTVPRKYLHEAVPDLTLSMLAASPQRYQGRLVVLGAVIVEEELRNGDLWLHVTNRPLDQDYHPQLPPSPSDREAGGYWVIVSKAHPTLPGSYRHWAEMTLVGRVAGTGPEGEPLLHLVYARGWGMTPEHDGVWEHTVDMNYPIVTPPQLLRDSSQ